MPTALSDPSAALYVILIVFVAVAGAIWSRKRTRPNLVTFAVAVAALAALFLIDRLVESPREEATRRVEAMAAAATAVDPVAFLENVSPSFSAYGADREKLRQSGAWGLIKQHQVRVAVWGFGHDQYEKVSDTEIELGFFAKAQTPNREGLGRYVRARFVRDSDGQYRVKSMKFYQLIDTKVEESIPGFP